MSEPFEGWTALDFLNSLGIAGPNIIHVEQGMWPDGKQSEDGTWDGPGNCTCRRVWPCEALAFYNLLAAHPPEVDAEGEDIRVCAKRLAEYLEHRVGCPALRNISKRDECVCGLNALLDRAIPAATEAERE